MKNCPNCNTPCDDNMAFCQACGAPLNGQPAPNYAAPAYAAPATPDYVHTAEFDPKDISDNKVFAMLPYILSIAGVIVALLASQDSPFTKFHVRQGLKILVCEMLVAIVGAIVPFLGWFVILPIGLGILEVIAIICFFQVCSGKAVEPAIIRSLKFLK